MYEISKDNLDKLLAWLNEQPHKFAAPLVAFLQENLKPQQGEATGEVQDS